MIYFFWLLNVIFAMIIAMLIRKLFSNIFLKRIIYAIFLSLFLTSWFLYPGSQNLAPILPIYLIDLLESQNPLQMRLIRPFLLVAILIFIFDFLIFRYKSKKK